jgi:electron transfer flavoprotein beta subunit
LCNFSSFSLAIIKNTLFLQPHHHIILNKMSLKIIVLAKQVPDTRNVGKDAMKADGTVNRAALPAIFNPEDLNALEQALRLKDQFPGTTVTLLTMGPPRAADIIREGLFRGADGGYLLTDRAFAGADTLATGYALQKAIRKLGSFDLIISGRQAIDGDTAQVGPQVAEKLNIPQITYAEEIQSIENGQITVKRRLERGIEIVEGKLPVLVTVTGSAPVCRPRNAKLIQKYKYAKTASERNDNNNIYYSRDYLSLNEWNAVDINADVQQCGLHGSPTKVKKIESVVFQAKESKTLDSSDQQIEDLMMELIANHTFG